MILLNSKQTIEINGGERGVAFIEFALVIPPLLLLCTFVFDFGMAIDRYLTLTRISYEAARYGSQLGGLESQTVSQATWDASTDRPPIHTRLRERIIKLVDENDLALRDIEIETSLKTTAASNSIVEISITSRYQSFFTQVGTIPLSVEARAPYLYPGA